jgi:hypothetical protein
VVGHEGAGCGGSGHVVGQSLSSGVGWSSEVGWSWEVVEGEGAGCGVGVMVVVVVVVVGGVIVAVGDKGAWGQMVVVVVGHEGAGRHCHCVVVVRQLLLLWVRR